MLNGFIDIYRFVKREYSPFKLSFGKVYVKVKIIKNKAIHKKTLKRLRIVKILKGLIRC